MTPVVMEGMAEHQRGNLDVAEALYRKVLAAEPAEPDALHYLGVLQFQNARQQEGLALIRESLAINGENAHAWNSLGNVLKTTGEAESACTAYQTAVRLAPQMHQAWHNLAMVLFRLRRSEESIAAFEQVVAARPDYDEAYEHLGRLYYRVGDVERARKVYRTWLTMSPDHPVPRHMAAATGAEDVAPPSRAGDQYVRELFNTHAHHFDENLLGLGYRAPQLMLAALDAQPQAHGRSLDILDAGCGTGLCAPLLRPRAARLDGVDLSDKMIELAHKRALYDELVVGELSATMRERPRRYDAIISADTLVYFGELAEPALAAAACLRPGGWFIFTVEAMVTEGLEPGYTITPSGRYQHDRAYLTRALQAVGFATVDVRRETLRMEKHAEVAGWLVVGRLPG